jgi:DNA polymerase
LSEAAAPDRDPREELAELAASVRAYVEWQADTGAAGLPADDAAAALASLSPGAGVPPGKPGARPPAVPPGPRPPAFEPATPSWAAAEPRAAPPAAARPAPPAAPAAPRPAPIDSARAALRADAQGASSAAPSADAPDERRARLALIAEEVRSCTKCVLHEKRRQTVFARGNPLAELCFVGEGPGADEDAQGEPFVGAAGQLLDRMIAAMGYHRDDVYICNIVKCRPPSNRKPEPEEMAACTPYLTQQLALVKPRVLVALGATAVQGLVGTSEGITRLRGKWKLYKGTIPMMPTFHPAYLLRQPAAKRDVWNDLQEVMKHLGKSPAKA